MSTPEKMRSILTLIPGLAVPAVMTGEEAGRCRAALDRLIDRIPREVEKLRTSLFSHRDEEFTAQLGALRELLRDCFAIHLVGECDFIAQQLAKKKYAVCEAVTEKFVIGLLEFSLSAQTAQYEAEHAEDATDSDGTILLELLKLLEERLGKFDADGSLRALERIEAGGFAKAVLPLRREVENFNFIEARARLWKLRRSLTHGETAIPVRTGEKAMVLAVDDSPAVLAGLKGILGERYKFYAVTSGQAALTFLETHTPDVCIVDIEMPDMDGYELVDRMRKAGRTEAVMFLTGNATREYVLKAFAIGVTVFLVKPCREETLLQKLEALLHPVPRNRE